MYSLILNFRPSSSDMTNRPSFSEYSTNSLPASLHPMLHLQSLQKYCHYLENELSKAKRDVIKNLAEKEEMKANLTHLERKNAQYENQIKNNSENKLNDIKAKCEELVQTMKIKLGELNIDVSNADSLEMVWKCVFIHLSNQNDKIKQQEEAAQEKDEIISQNVVAGQQKDDQVHLLREQCADLESALVSYTNIF